MLQHLPGLLGHVLNPDIRCVYLLPRPTAWLSPVITFEATASGDFGSYRLETAGRAHP